MCLNYLIAALQVLFVFTSFTVEREYCQAPLDPSSSTPFVKETYDFGIRYNPLFHSRPEWLVKATCIHAYGFWVLYSLVFYLAVTDGWALSTTPAWLRRVLLPTLLGCKVNAILFYHYMEFTSDLPPPNLLAYFGSEGSYLVSIGLVFYKLALSAASSSSDATKDGKKD
uniref:Uncharacterized protein n=1 Tax=Pseudo-nitzschia australis TaxID=44445 RepID=A0A7S4AXR7_9STRA|mmetsp:Transcript_17117/g.37441  ORF Transcript_17117/g.37441 Transcript_17117/m.37441 type:complete len:169 (-) Transcript_17117:309-815(-)